MKPPGCVFHLLQRFLQDQKFPGSAVFEKVFWNLFWPDVVREKYSFRSRKTIKSNIYYEITRKTTVR